MIRIASPLVLALALSACTSSAQKAEREASAGLEAARAGVLTEAIPHFERALELDESNPKARYNLALAYLASRRGGEAATHLRKFLETRPDDAQAHFELGRALAITGRRDEALAELRRAAELGFADYAALDSGGLEQLEGELGFAQLRALLAQRAGVELGAEEHQPANGTGYGGVRVEGAVLPGSGTPGACEK